MKSPRPGSRDKRHVVYVTGTRADFNLLIPTLRAIGAHPGLRLSIVATGMHVDPRFGKRLSVIREAGFEADAVVPWRPTGDPRDLAEVTGRAVAELARMYRRLGADVVLVLGDRVEAFAAASAAHIGRYPLAHIHGGDRAEGQVDDALRHAVTQLAHLHFAASPDAVERLIRLGQDPRTVHLVGAPGVEGLASLALPPGRVREMFPDIARSAMVLLHPTRPDSGVEYRRAGEVYRALLEAGFSPGDILLMMPNNDPGSEGIREFWETRTGGAVCIETLPRPVFLGALRDCRVLVGNSSAGIIEAGSFTTPVINIGPRQSGRTAPEIVDSIPYGRPALRSALRRVSQSNRPGKSANPYSRPNTSRRIAGLLAASKISFPAPSKRLSY